MTTDGGGWTVLQRRFDGTLNFTRTYREYEDGFGDASGEHWIGLEQIHFLTTQRDNPVQLRVDICSFSGLAGKAEYNQFFITSQIDQYRFHPGTYFGGSDLFRLTGHNGLTFQTTGRCAELFKGGWWYGNCYDFNMNGGLYNGGEQHGIVWLDFGRERSRWASLKSSEMKIRPVHVADTATPYVCP